MNKTMKTRRNIPGKMLMVALRSYKMTRLSELQLITMTTTTMGKILKTERPLMIICLKERIQATVQVQVKYRHKAILRNLI